MDKAVSAAAAIKGGSPVKLLDRYIAFNYLVGMLPVMLLLLALFSFLALAEELEQVGEGAFRQVDAFMVVLYTSPRGWW